MGDLEIRPVTFNDQQGFIECVDRVIQSPIDAHFDWQYRNRSGPIRGFGAFLKDKNGCR
jgi:hypothetical protein